MYGYDNIVGVLCVCDCVTKSIVDKNAGSANW